MNNHAWIQQGQCLGEDPEIFYAADGEGNSSTAYNNDVARVYCQPCVVREICLADVLDYEWRRNAAHGVAGGMTPSARARLTLERRADLIEAGGRDATDIRAIIAARPATRTEAVCGTHAGYNKHRRNNTAACDACREAARIYQVQKRARQRGQQVPA